MSFERCFNDRFSVCFHACLVCTMKSLQTSKAEMGVKVFQDLKFRFENVSVFVSNIDVFYTVDYSLLE